MDRVELAARGSVAVGLVGDAHEWEDLSWCDVLWSPEQFLRQTAARTTRERAEQARGFRHTAAAATTRHVVRLEVPRVCRVGSQRHQMAQTNRSAMVVATSLRILSDEIHTYVAESAGDRGRGWSRLGSAARGVRK